MFKSNLTKLIASSLALLIVATPLSAFAATNPAAQTAAAAGVQYLAANQNADGSVSGFGGESEWSAIAVQANGLHASNFAHGGASLVDFLSSDVPASDASATTIERKILALSAAGQDSTSFGGHDYSAQLASLSNNGQIGDDTLVNDDIFGLLAIDASHDAQLVQEARDARDFILAHQASDGGFSYTTVSCAYCGSDSNDTAAAIMALSAAEDLGLSNTSLSTAKQAAITYLLGTQQSDGGFGYDAYSPSDGSSTAWSLMALNTIGDSVASQAVLARNWLLANQNPDGGFSFAAYGYTDSDTSTTAHAITAILGSTWLLRPAPYTPTAATQPPVLATTEPSSASPSTPIANQKVAVQSVSTNKSRSTNPVVVEDTSPAEPAFSPQVKGASVVAPKTNRINTPIVAQTSKSTSRYSMLGVGVLALVALVWFVLESRKSRKDV